MKYARVKITYLCAFENRGNGSIHCLSVKFLVKIEFIVKCAQLGTKSWSLEKTQDETP